MDLLEHTWSILTRGAAHVCLPLQHFGCSKHEVPFARCTIEAFCMQAAKTRGPELNLGWAGGPRAWTGDREIELVLDSWCMVPVW